MSHNKMGKRQQRTIGSIVKIDLENGYHSYARILDKANFAFYDIYTKKETDDLEYIVSKPILFIIAVYDDVITKGRWQKIGKLPLEDHLKKLPFKFIQDLHTKEINMYDPNTGETFGQLSKMEAEKIECAAVWEANHVEDRLRDHFNGNNNIWVEKLKPE